MWRDTRQEVVLSQFRTEHQYYHHQEGQSEQFQQSQAELRQHSERTNAENVQFINLCEETENCECQNCTRSCLLVCNVAKSRDGVTHSCIKFEVELHQWT